MIDWLACVCVLFLILTFGQYIYVYIVKWSTATWLHEGHCHLIKPIFQLALLGVHYLSDCLLLKKKEKYDWSSRDNNDREAAERRQIHSFHWHTHLSYRIKEIYPSFSIHITADEDLSNHKTYILSFLSLIVVLLVLFSASFFSLIRVWWKRRCR
jgi:hypothetical protein